MVNGENEYQKVSLLIDTEIPDINLFLNMDSRHTISAQISNGLQWYIIINQ